MRLHLQLNRMLLSETQQILADRTRALKLQQKMAKCTNFFLLALAEIAAQRLDSKSGGSRRWQRLGIELAGRRRRELDVPEALLLLEYVSDSSSQGASVPTPAKVHERSRNSGSFVAFRFSPCRNLPLWVA